MKIVKQALIRIFSLTMFLYSSIAFSGTSESVAGTWILDSPATEKLVLSNLPYDDSRSFTTSLLYMGSTVFEFNREIATVGFFAGPNKTRFYLDSTSAGQAKYVAQNPQNGKSTALTAKLLPDDHLSIISSDIPSMRYLLWKKVTLDPNKNRPEDYKPELDAWMATVQNIVKALGEPLQ